MTLPVMVTWPSRCSSAPLIVGALGPLMRMFARAGRVVVVLDRAAGDGDLGVRAAGAVDEDVRGRRAVLALVALDVATGDLEVAHLARPARRSRRRRSS